MRARIITCSIVATALVAAGFVLPAGAECESAYAVIPLPATAYLSGCAAEISEPDPPWTGRYSRLGDATWQVDAGGTFVRGTVVARQNSYRRASDGLGYRETYAGLSKYARRGLLWTPPPLGAASAGANASAQQRIWYANGSAWASRVDVTGGVGVGSGAVRAGADVHVDEVWGSSGCTRGARVVVYPGTLVDRSTPRVECGARTPDAPEVPALP